MKFSTILLSLLVAGFLYVPADAAPSVKRTYNGIEIKEAVDDNALSFIKAEKSKLKKVFSVHVEKITDADLAKLIDAYPDIQELTIAYADNVTNIAPVAKLTQLTKFEGRALHKVKDFSPLAGLTSLKYINVTSEGMTGDLKWMSGLVNLTSISVGAKNVTSFEGIPSLPKLTSVNFHYFKPADLTPLVKALPKLRTLNLNYCIIEDLTPLAQLAELDTLSLYGATVKDFSPLAQCPKLKKVTYYATNCDNYATLGALKQVSVLGGGLTKLADISWIADMPNVKEFNVFAEYVTDYSPLAKTNIENFTIWNMRKPVGDLGIIGKMPQLKKLRLWGVAGATNSVGLASLANLVDFTISGDFNKQGGEPFDLAATAGWAKVDSMTIEGTELINADKIPAMPELKSLTLRRLNPKSKTPFDISAFANSPKLQYVTIYNSAVSGFDKLSNPNLRRITLNNVQGLTSLEGLKKCTNLTLIEITKCDIPDAALQGFDPKIKIRKR